MGSDVKRQYDSSRRREQARQTRRQIVAAAHDLFVERGYGGTTIGDIAAAAGVSVETIYSAFGSKPNLLKKVWDVTIGGDDEEVVFHERPHVVEIRKEPDVARRLERYAELYTNTVAPRAIPFALALKGAAGAEPEARAMIAEMNRQRFEGMALAAADLERSGRLKVSVEEARDILWATNAGELWDSLVNDRGWPPSRFATFLGDLWKRLLLEDE